MKGRNYGLRLKVEGLKLVLICLIVAFTLLYVQAQNDSIFNKNPGSKDTNIYHLEQINTSTLKSIKVADIRELLVNKMPNKNIVTNNLNLVFRDTVIQPLTLSGASYFIPNKKRIKLMTIANIAGYGLATYGFYTAWYKDQPTTSFHFFNDNAEWLQMDKAGHVYGAYIGSKGSMELWRWTGISRKKRILLGGLSGLAFQTMIETFDGFGENWGWSWGDFGANVVGASLLMGQEFLWNEQRIDVKFSFHRKNYQDATLNERADSLYGTGILSRMVKDYNGQTYWLSANIKSFFPKANVPSWLNVAVGYGGEGMFEGRKNIWKDGNGNTIDRTDIPRYRQWYIAPDINLTKIKTNNKFLKKVLFFFNAFKFPLPSIGFSKKGVEWNWLHF
jgi:uncharacterized protein YfiM (DUF2279 family)